MKAAAANQDLWRHEAPHVLTALLRRWGNFADCEDAVAEALLAAATQWPTDGMPDNPRGWLIRVASRRLIDAQRSSAARERREVDAAAAVSADAAFAPAAEVQALEPVGDDTLQLYLLCCHESLSSASQVALTLRAVAGLSTAQIAAGFDVPESTMAQRISRAKATLQQAGARFDELPADLDGRMHGVRHVLYLIFNEGYAASAGDQLLDGALTREAIRLTGQLASVSGDDETAGLLALMLLTDARAAARTDAAGDLVPLADQDRRRWNRPQIDAAVAEVERLLTAGPVGPFQLQAAVAAVHAEASTYAGTDWLQICALYRMLHRVAPSPAVTLNLAIAVGMAQGPAAGLDALNSLLQKADQQRNHRMHAAHAHLLELLGDVEGAATAYRTAARLTRSIPEQHYLNRRLARLRQERAQLPVTSTLSKGR